MHQKSGGEINPGDAPSSHLRIIIPAFQALPVHFQGEFPVRGNVNHINLSANYAGQKNCFAGLFAICNFFDHSLPDIDFNFWKTVNWMTIWRDRFVNCGGILYLNPIRIFWGHWYVAMEEGERACHVFGESTPSFFNSPFPQQLSLCVRENHVTEPG